jgi:hypothetical protein
MTLRKTGPDAVEQHYRYDDEQRIAQVSFSGHKEFSRGEYRYDALGRRTQKILHRHHKLEETISFLWSGLRVVSESSNLTPEPILPALFLSANLSQMHQRLTFSLRRASGIITVHLLCLHRSPSKKRHPAGCP